MNSKKRNSLPALNRSTTAGHIQLQGMAYRQTLNSVQSRLKGVDQFFSRAVHNQSFGWICELLAKLSGHPVGVLVGGISAFLGSMILWYMSNTYGFTYPPATFIAFYISGFALGLLGEFIARFLRRH